jgi:hypothetical protein
VLICREAFKIQPENCKMSKRKDIGDKKKQRFEGEEESSSDEVCRSSRQTS